MKENSLGITDELFERLQDDGEEAGQEFFERVAFALADRKADLVKNRGLYVDAFRDGYTVGAVMGVALLREVERHG